MILTLNLTLIAASLAILGINKIDFGGRAKQLLVRLTLTTALVSPIAATLVPAQNIFTPPLQVAATASANKTIVVVTTPKPVTFAPTTQSLDYAQLALLILTASTIFARLYIRTRDRYRLKKISREAITIRKIGRTEIKVSANTQTPFAARLERKALVVLPENLVGRAAFNTAIRHELQHHRQSDLQWNTLLEAARFIAGWNPLVQYSLERIEEIDELACDETLVEATSPQLYARCLLEVAALQTSDFAKLAGTARMAASKTFLRRRIEMTLHRKPTPHAKTIFAAALAIALTASAAWASEGLIKDRRIGETKAAKLAGQLHMPFNKRVLKFLNLATSTPRNRFYMRNALKRASQYKPMIEAKLMKAGLPQDLLALPLMESGYQNTETATSAGLWQFIPETARKFGLQVDDTKDERLDADKETDAAAAYLASLQTKFQNDLMLSLLSYNAGESQVQTWIDKTGTRDVFQWADDGTLKSDENANYDAKFIASLIILNNPTLVAE